MRYRKLAVIILLVWLIQLTGRRDQIVDIILPGTISPEKSFQLVLEVYSSCTSLTWRNGLREMIRIVDKNHDSLDECIFSSFYLILVFIQ